MNNLISLFRNMSLVNYMSLRTCSAYKMPEPIQYYGFKYYPRHEGFKDPPYTPSKLFFIKRMKSVKGRTPEERKILEHLNIDGNKKDNGHVSVVKNIPQINAMLWKVKHLVYIKPIRWEGDLPKDLDTTGTHLRETGELIISPRLKVTSKCQEATEKYAKNLTLTTAYMRDHLMKKWVDGFHGTI